MADTLLHITLAKQIAQHPQLHDDLRQLLPNDNDDYLMGSVAFDLPYYDNLLFNGIQSMRGRSVAYHPYGQRIHETAGRKTCVALIDSATDRATLAFAMGALTHFAVDIVFHREIEERIQHTAISHDALERLIGLICHYRILGHSGVGTATALKSTCLFPQSDWRYFFSEVLSRFHTGTPSAEVFKRWQRSLRSFGILYSKPWFPWLNTRVQPTDNKALDSLAVEMMDEALNKAVTYLNGARAFKNGQLSLTDLESIIPPLRMSDGLQEF